VLKKKRGMIEALMFVGAARPDYPMPRLAAFFSHKCFIRGLRYLAHRRRKRHRRARTP
jgi:hypothetical protein